MSVVPLCTCSTRCTCTPAVPAAAGCCAVARAAAAASAAASARRLASKVSRIAWTCLQRRRATVKRQHSTGTAPQPPSATAAQTQAGDYWLSRAWHLQMPGCIRSSSPWLWTAAVLMFRNLHRHQCIAQRVQRQPRSTTSSRLPVGARWQLVSRSRSSAHAPQHVGVRPAGAADCPLRAADEAPPTPVQFVRV